VAWNLRYGTSKQLTLITQQEQITPAMRDIFRRVIGQKNQVSNLETQIKSHQ